MAIEYFHIRDNDYDLLDQLIEIEDNSGERGSGLNAFELYSLIRYGRVYAAMEYDEILGYVMFQRDFDNPSKVFLHSVYIAPKERGGALAETLLLSAFDDLADDGVRMVEVLSSPSNKKALDMYCMTLDFKIINIPDGGSIYDEDFLIMRKVL